MTTISHVFCYFVFITAGTFGSRGKRQGKTNSHLLHVLAGHTISYAGVARSIPLSWL